MRNFVFVYLDTLNNLARKKIAILDGDTVLPAKGDSDTMFCL